MGDVMYCTDDNLELRIVKSSDGMYHMTISKEYAIGTKDELINEVSSDFNHLVKEFERLKSKRKSDSER